MATINNSLNAPIPFSATKGGTGLVSPTAHGILIAEGAAAMVSLVLGAGQVLIGTTAGDPTPATLTAGSGISINNASGAITISASNSVSWVSVAGTSQAVARETGYVAANAALVSFTLPATASLGDEYKIVASTAGGWTLLPGTTTQTIRFGNTITTASTGSISSTSIGDTIDVVCTNATTPGSEVFTVVNSVGNLNVV